MFYHTTTELTFPESYHRLRIFQIVMELASDLNDQINKNREDHQIEQQFAELHPLDEGTSQRSNLN